MADRTVILRARKFLTMEPGYPEVEAVALRGDRIVAVGSLESVQQAVGNDFVIDNTHHDHIVLPGLIDQHLHPLLGASTLATEVIAIEDWILPDRTFPAASSPDEYFERLRSADEGLDDPDEWLLSWGYHESWHGHLDRDLLDQVSATRPIGIWQRSCHEWYMNSAAIAKIGLTEADLTGRGLASTQVDLAEGHFWEAGFFNLVMPKIAPALLSRERLTRGLHQLVAYLRQNGVTAFNEPGIIWEIEPWDLYQEILGADDVPFLSTFIVDGRTQAAKGIAPVDAIADAERQIALAAEGKVSMLPRQVKLFADGAIISQLMQMKDPYLDHDGRPDPEHQGEWLMEPDVLRGYFDAYWDAGWQIHTHVNGDLGLDVVLDCIEGCMVRSPRADHRCVIVHFANSTEEQVDRIARLGAIVSANPYYPCGFADKYGEYGLGPERADSMVRSKSVLDRHIPLSFHSDLPMAPAAPLQLAGFAVDRLTQSGRVAGPEHRIDVESALRAVTIEAAYSWRRENDLGSIAPGKLATFTVLASDPTAPDAAPLDEISVLGSIFEGRWSPAPQAATRNSQAASRLSATLPLGGHDSALHQHDGCSCDVARHLARAYRSLRAA